MKWLEPSLPWGIHEIALGQSGGAPAFGRFEDLAPGRNSRGRQISASFSRAVLIEQACPCFLEPAVEFLPNWEQHAGGLGMGQRTSFAQMKAEQAKLTEHWKAEGRLSEAWAVADPEIVEIFSAGIAFGLEMGKRGRKDPAYSPDEWRKALREAVEKAAALEGKLEKAKEAMLKAEN
jgi:hypothetical protein